MSPEHDPIDPRDSYEEEPPRSIFAATWFRVVLVLIVLGVVGAVAVPYVMDWMSPPPASVPIAKAPPRSAAPATPSAPPAPAEKKEPTMVPAPATGTPAARSEPRAPVKSETARPGLGAAAEPKTAEKRPAARTPTAPPAAAEKLEPDTRKEAAGKPAEARRAPARKSTTARTARAGAAVGGPWWVQVGAFRDPEAARRLAARLREQNYHVEETTTSAGPAAAAPRATPPAEATPPAIGSDKYDVFITGMSVAEIDRRLTAKGLAGEVSGSGVVIRPSLPLREAVALSKDLAVEGMKVQVRRAGVAEPASRAGTPPAPPGEATGGETLHRVRVGSFPDRATATAALRDLEARGYKGFVTRSDR